MDALEAVLTQFKGRCVFDSRRKHERKMKASSKSVAAGAPRKRAPRALQQDLFPRSTRPARFRNDCNRSLTVWAGIRWTPESTTRTEKMATTHKEANLMPLLAFLAAHAIAAAAVITAGATPNVDSLRIESLLPGGLAIVVGLVVVALLNGQLSWKAKARFVFWRWQDPLPGGEAFSRWLREDDRIDVAVLEARYGPFPTDRAAQNKLWFKIYSSVDDRPAVQDANREFLFFRDAAVLGALATVLLAATTFFVTTPWGVRVLYVAALILVELAVVRAARLSGVRLVRNALAAAVK